MNATTIVPELPTRLADSLRNSALLIAGLFALAAECRADEPFTPIALQSRIARVQPMTGIVLWTTSEHNRTDAIPLEYSYMKYNDVVAGRGQYDWGSMDRTPARTRSSRLPQRARTASRSNRRQPPSTSPS
jgi:hypothetical protein